MPKPVSPAQVAVFSGADAGKDTQHAVALDRTGKRLYDKALPNDEGRLRAMIAALRRHGQLLAVVDQPSTIGALSVSVVCARASQWAICRGWPCAASPICSLGEAKTDARDAASIAEGLPHSAHALRTLKADCGLHSPRAGVHRWHEIAVHGAAGR